MNGERRPAVPDRPPLLSIEDLRVVIETPRGRQSAVDGIDLEVASGEIVGIVGESGSGKSVTALSVMRLFDIPNQATTGRILFEGADILRMREDELRRLRGNRISMILQDPMTSLNPVLRIGDQLIEGILAHRGEAAATARRNATELLRKMGLTTPDAAMRRFPHQFSGGMRQRIMLAMGFGNSPSLLIADEPTTALDVTIQAQILDLLRNLNEEFGTAILLITHDLGVVASLCRRVVVMYNGRIVETGPAELILGDPRHPYTQGLIAAIPRIDRMRRIGRSPAGGGERPEYRRPQAGGCCFLDRCRHRMERCAEAPPLRARPGGRTVACWLENPAVPPAAHAAPASKDGPGMDPSRSRLLVEARRLTRHFTVSRGGLFRPARRVHALDDVSLTVRAGETLGLVGESGSGKSTLARLIVRIHKPTAGEIFFEGNEIGEMDERALRPLRRHLQMIFQDPYSSLNPRLTVASAVAEPMLLHGLAESRDAARRRVLDLLARVGLSRDSASRYPHEFSGGQRQRIGIARALAAEPKLVVCDEPISSLDVNIQAQIIDLLMQLQADSGLTYIFISHNLAVVRQIAHRIVVLYLGKVVEIASAEALFSQPLHPYTRSLMAAVPVPDVAIEHARQRHRLTGEMPSVLEPPSGCRFRTRCPIATTRCAEEAPPLRPASAGHEVACHFPGAG
ncbi:MAG: dipeptide ABC transporter ATP-binding protein [Parvibaculaceae bacterium]